MRSGSSDGPCRTKPSLIGGLVYCFGNPLPSNAISSEERYEHAESLGGEGQRKAVHGVTISFRSRMACVGPKDFSNSSQKLLGACLNSAEENNWLDSSTSLPYRGSLVEMHPSGLGTPASECQYKVY